MATSRIISLVFAVLLLAAVFGITRSMEAGARTFVMLLLPLVCIWFGEPIGSYANPHSGIRYPTPGLMVTIAGWILLAAFAFAFVIVPLLG